MFISSHNHSAGFSISELIIAIAILTFGILVVYGSFYSIFNSAHNISTRFVAAYLGQEALETIRNFRDANKLNSVNFDTGLVGGPCSTSAGCQLDYSTQNYSQLVPYEDTFLALNNEGLYSYDIGAATPFKREIIISPVSTGVIKVEVTVTWSYKDQLSTLQMKEYLYDHY